MFRSSCSRSFLHRSCREIYQLQTAQKKRLDKLATTVSIDKFWQLPRIYCSSKNLTLKTVFAVWKGIYCKQKNCRLYILLCSIACPLFNQTIRAGDFEQFYDLIIPVPRSYDRSNRQIAIFQSNSAICKDVYRRSVYVRSFRSFNNWCGNYNLITL